MRYLPLYGAIAALVSSGVLHGLRTDRWGRSADLSEAAARLESLPMQIGDWEGRPQEIDAHQLEVADVAGYLSRRYVNSKTGDSVTVLLLCGRPGPISVHEPDVCYGAAGYELAKDSKEKIRVSAEGKEAEAWAARFLKLRPTPESLGILWSWSDGGPWKTPDNPRASFARAGVLYKVYVLRSLNGTPKSLKYDPAGVFFHSLLPELEKCTLHAS